jgi:hypothetical protein
VIGIGLGAGFCVVLGAVPARAVTVGSATAPTLPPLAVAPGPITVGPATLDPTASVTPDATQIQVATGGLPVAEGGPDLGLNLGSDGAQVGVGGVGAGVVLSPPPAIAPGTASSSASDGPTSPASAVGPSSSSGAAGLSPHLKPAPAPPPSSSADPKVVPLSNGSPAAVTGAVDAARKRSWWSLATSAARVSFLWIVLLLAALVIRHRVSAALRDQRGVSAARSA